MSTPRPSTASDRFYFLDGLRGIALILMVLNHTSRDWIDRSIGPGRFYLVYGSLLLPAAIFIFLVGFCLPLSLRRLARPDSFRTAVVKYFRRGIPIVGAGFLLNVVVPVEGTHLWSGGVLQTIGLCIILLGPAVPLLRQPATRYVMLAVAVGIYVAFSVSYGSLVHWAAAHPVAADVVVGDFPLWPWISCALIGLVVGWIWLERRALGESEEARFFRLTAIFGVLCILAFYVTDWLRPMPKRFGVPWDFSLNGHWTPRGVTIFLVAGGVALLLAASYRVMHARRWKLPWLVTLGQTALMLYFVHQVIEFTLVSYFLNLKFHSWWLYWAANVVFIVLLVYLGRAWPGIKRFTRQAVLRPAATTP